MTASGPTTGEVQSRSPRLANSQAATCRAFVGQAATGQFSWEASTDSLATLFVGLPPTLSCLTQPHGCD